MHRQEWKVTDSSYQIQMSCGGGYETRSRPSPSRKRMEDWEVEEPVLYTTIQTILAVERRYGFLTATICFDSMIEEQRPLGVLREIREEPTTKMISWTLDLSIFESHWTFSTIKSTTEKILFETSVEEWWFRV